VSVGLDLSRRDLATARTRCADFDILEQDERRPAFVEGDGARLPFADATFDRVICSEVLEHITDYESFLREIKRVIKPGGIFAASVPSFFSGVGVLATERSLP
jgi:ubiquinone/menaquinone biosynthesis C-methylase UbiE